jgi:hypothetical protein
MMLVLGILLQTPCTSAGFFGDSSQDTATSATNSFGTCIKGSISLFPKDDPTCAKPEVDEKACKFGGNSSSYYVSCKLPELEKKLSKQLLNIAGIPATTATLTAMADAKLGFEDPFAINFNFLDKTAHLMVPALKLSADAEVEFKAMTKVDPCGYDGTKCRLQEKYTVYSAFVMAGFVPIALMITGEAYVYATPICDGNLDATLKVGLHPIDLSNAVDLDLRQPGNVGGILTQLFSHKDIVKSIEDNLFISIKGTVEATASLKVCAGVKLMLQVDGVSATLDVPVCMTANLTVHGSVEVDGPDGITIDAKLYRNNISLDYAIGLPSVASLLDDVCGAVEMATSLVAGAETAFGTATRCRPDASKCGDNLKSSVCNIVDDLTTLSVAFTNNSVPIVPEQVVLTKTVKGSKINLSTFPLLSTGAIVAIVIVSLALVALLVAGVILYKRRRAGQQQQQDEPRMSWALGNVRSTKDQREAGSRGYVPPAKFGEPAGHYEAL